MKAKEKKNNKIEPKSKEMNYFYLTEEAKNWEFSDFVRVTPGPRGMKLGFGKFVDEDKKFGLFKEITIPYDVAESLMQIMREQFNSLLKDGVIKKITPSEDK